MRETNPHKWSESYSKRLKALWPSVELSVKDIGEQLGFSGNTIQRKARELGLEPRTNVTRTNWTDSRVLQLTELTRLGLSASKIAREMPFGRSAIIGKQIRMGIVKPKPVKSAKFAVVENGPVTLAAGVFGKFEGKTITWNMPKT